MDCSLPGSSVHELLQERILEWLPFISPGDLPTQGSNLGLLHCRQILYRLSPQGSCVQVGPQAVLCDGGGVMAVLPSGEAPALSAAVLVPRLGSTAG